MMPLCTGTAEPAAPARAISSAEHGAVAEVLTAAAVLLGHGQAEQPLPAGPRQASRLTMPSFSHCS